MITARRAGAGAVAVVEGIFVAVVEGIVPVFFKEWIVLSSTASG